MKWLQYMHYITLHEAVSKNGGWAVQTFILVTKISITGRNNMKPDKHQQVESKILIYHELILLINDVMSCIVSSVSIVPYSM